MPLPLTSLLDWSDCLTDFPGLFGWQCTCGGEVWFAAAQHCLRILRVSCVWGLKSDRETDSWELHGPWHKWVAEQRALSHLSGWRRRTAEQRCQCFACHGGDSGMFLHFVHLNQDLKFDIAKLTLLVNLKENTSFPKASKNYLFCFGIVTHRSRSPYHFAGGRPREEGTWIFLAIWRVSQLAKSPNHICEEIFFFSDFWVSFVGSGLPQEDLEEREEVEVEGGAKCPMIISLQPVGTQFSCDLRDEEINIFCQIFSVKLLDLGEGTKASGEVNSDMAKVFSQGHVHVAHCLLFCNFITALFFPFLPPSFSFKMRFWSLKVEFACWVSGLMGRPIGVHLWTTERKAFRKLCEKDYGWFYSFFEAMQNIQERPTKPSDWSDETPYEAVLPLPSEVMAFLRRQMEIPTRDSGIRSAAKPLGNGRQFGKGAFLCMVLHPFEKKKELVECCKVRTVLMDMASAPTSSTLLFNLSTFFSKIYHTCSSCMEFL